MSADSPPLQQDLPDARLANPGVADNVDSLVATVRDLLSGEDARDQSFNARGVGLAGFVGIIVSLTTTLGRDALRADVADPWRIVCIALFGAALLLLLATVFVVVRGVLTPKPITQLATTEVEQYELPDCIFRPRGDEPRADAAWAHRHSARGARSSQRQGAGAAQGVLDAHGRPGLHRGTRVYPRAKRRKGDS